MTFSGSQAALVLILGLACLPGESREDPVELIRRHRYEEAIAIFDRDVAGGKQDEKAVLRSLKGRSLAYLRLGSLYDTFSRLSLAIMEDYYANLIEEGVSGLNHLYLGQIQFSLGRLAEAKASFDAARKAGGAPSTAEMADVFHFFARRRLGEAGASGDPGLSPKDNSAQWQLAELRGEMPSGLPGASQRGRRSRLSLLARSPNPAESDLEASVKAVLADGQQPEMYLDHGKNTQINFYDPFLLGTLSDGFYALSKATNLRIKDAERKFPDLASKFGTDLALAEACLRLGHLKEAAVLIGAGTGLAGGILKAQLLARQRRGKEAGKVLESLAKDLKGPNDKRDLAEAHHLLGIGLDEGLKLAASAVRDRNGPAYHRTYANLLFASGQPDAAIQQYAKGYKIEYRNRIDQIDPEYMADYSLAIFRTNKLRYEEIVETLYHLQKEFPSCRQMHYCMQGISAGLARSYESQKIFRKGG